MAVKSTVKAASSGKAPAARPARRRAGEFYRGDDYPIMKTVGYKLKQLRVGLERAVDAEMVEHDLTGVQWGPLLMIRHGFGTTAAELARVGCVDTGAMTRMLDRLAAKGLIQRTPCAKDRRVFQLELTPAGRQLCDKIPFGLARASNALLHGFTQHEFETLNVLLDRMLLNVEKR